MLLDVTFAELLRAKEENLETATHELDELDAARYHPLAVDARKHDLCSFYTKQSGHIIALLREFTLNTDFCNFREDGHQGENATTLKNMQNQVRDFVFLSYFLCGQHENMETSVIAAMGMDAPLNWLQEQFFNNDIPSRAQELKQQLQDDPAGIYARLLCGLQAIDKLNQWIDEGILVSKNHPTADIHAFTTDLTHTVLSADGGNTLLPMTAFEASRAGWQQTSSLNGS